MKIMFDDDELDYGDLWSLKFDHSLMRSLMQSPHAKWSSSLWKDTFKELLNNNDELDYGDPWEFRIKKSLTVTLTDEEKRKGWKVHSYRAHGKYVFPHRLSKGLNLPIMLN